MSNRYSLSFRPRTLIPTVEVDMVTAWPELRHTTVRVVRGFTDSHAYRRALLWTRKQGDTR